MEQALWESGFGDVLDVDDALTRVDPGALHLTGDSIVAHGGVEGQHHAAPEQQLLRLGQGAHRLFAGLGCGLIQQGIILLRLPAGAVAVGIRGEVLPAAPMAVESDRGSSAMS